LSEDSLSLINLITYSIDGTLLTEELNLDSDQGIRYL